MRRLLRYIDMFMVYRPVTFTLLVIIFIVLVMIVIAIPR